MRPRNKYELSNVKFLSSLPESKVATFIWLICKAICIVILENIRHIGKSSRIKGSRKKDKPFELDVAEYHVDEED